MSDQTNGNGQADAGQDQAADADPAQPKKNIATWKFVLAGGVGGLTPVVLTIAIADTSLVQGYIDSIRAEALQGIMSMSGYIVQALALFFIGGIWVWVQKAPDLAHAFQLGIVAPAMITGAIALDRSSTTPTPQTGPGANLTIEREYVSTLAYGPNANLSDLLVLTAHQVGHITPPSPFRCFVRGFIRKPCT